MKFEIKPNRYYKITYADGVSYINKTDDKIVYQLVNIHKDYTITNTMEDVLYKRKIQDWEDTINRFIKQGFVTVIELTEAEYLLELI